MFKRVRVRRAEVEGGNPMIQSLLDGGQWPPQRLRSAVGDPRDRSLGDHDAPPWVASAAGFKSAGPCSALARVACAMRLITGQPAVRPEQSGQGTLSALP